MSTPGPRTPQVPAPAGPPAGAPAVQPAERTAERPAERPETSAPTPAVRAQLLATEHWSLLATRSTTWSEVMSRISIHLTVSSAALVVLALVAQASGFGAPFRLLSIGLASVALVLGTLTGLRVINASSDDAMLVLGMNRLRAAYTDLDPGLAGYLTTSTHDDQAGLMATYLMGSRRPTLSHVLASTAMFMNVVNALVAGTLGALVADAAGAEVVGIAVTGAAAGLGYLLVFLEVGRRVFGSLPVEARFPTTPVRGGGQAP